MIQKWCEYMDFHGVLFSGPLYYSKSLVSLSQVASLLGLLGYCFAFLHFVLFVVSVRQGIWLSNHPCGYLLEYYFASLATSKNWSWLAIRYLLLFSILVRSGMSQGAKTSTTLIYNTHLYIWIIIIPSNLNNQLNNLNLLESELISGLNTK